MLTKKESLSPDLEWMLQSDQVDDDALIQALVQSYYPRIFRQALAWLTYPEEARRTAQETFVQAVLKSSTYRGSISVDEWLDNIYIQVRDERYALLQSQLLLNPLLIKSIKDRFEDNDLSPQEIELATQDIKFEVHSRMTASSKRITAQVLGLLGVMLVVVLILVGSRDYWSPEPVSDNPLSSHERAPSEIITSQQDVDHDSQAAQAESLTLSSTSDEIKERIMTSSQYWSTMWAELVVTFHGPDSYIGPPHEERHQFWINPQRGGILVSGPLNEFPNFIERFDIPAGMDIGDRATYGSTYARFGSQLPWFPLNLETIMGIPYVLNYLADATITEDLQTVTYTPVGVQHWAGYQALIVDLTSDGGIPIGRINLESETGIILREQYYAPGSNRRTFIESSLKDLNFNQPVPTMWKRPDSVIFSPRMFRPEPKLENEATSSWSDTTSPYRLTGAAPPSNYDPARASLVFFKSYPFSDQEAETETYDIYADNFHLGKIDLIDPLHMICTRSQGGDRIAFTNWTFDPGGGETTIYWFDLHELQVSGHYLPEMVLHWIGFSPDGRLLGMSGFNETYGDNQFFLLDTENGATRYLPIPASFNRLTWSPDGSQIVVLEEAGSSFESESGRIINVYSAIDGHLEDKFKVEGDLPDLTHLKIPLDGWEAEFNLSIQDVSSCTAPPGN